MSNADEMRQSITAQLRAGETMHTPQPVSLDASEQDEWTPPALNDGPLLKSQIMAAIKGEPIPGHSPTPADDYATLIADIQAGIDRLNTND